MVFSMVLLYKGSIMYPMGLFYIDIFYSKISLTRPTSPDINRTLIP